MQSVVRFPAGSVRSKLLKIVVRPICHRSRPKPWQRSSASTNRRLVLKSTTAGECTYRLENPTERKCWRDGLVLGNFRYLMCDCLTDVASVGVATEIRRANFRACQDGFKSPFHACAAAGSPRCCNIIAPDQICAMGLAIPFPAMSGAEPCTGSNMEGYCRSGLRLAEGANPMEPTTAAPRSDKISPNRFDATTTSNHSGCCTK